MQIVTAARPIVHVGPARRVTGRFATPADPKAIQPVKLAAGATAYRVGMGRIYRDRVAALDFARAREVRAARIAAAYARIVAEAAREAAPAEAEPTGPTEADDAYWAIQTRQAGSDGPFIDADPAIGLDDEADYPALDNAADLAEARERIENGWLI